ncbi:MAG: class I SAM-dependent methyltransferase [Pseudomonadota bacterium]
MTRDPLTQLAIRHGTDKWGEHFYTPHYHALFADRRQRPLTVLEIGVGGYANRHCGGLSLLMWRDYFPHGRIIGFDLAEKALPAQERITLVRGDQSDPEHLARLAADHGPFDIIIDDGSHRSGHVIASFEHLFPHLAPDGIYVVEDTQTAYMPSFGGSWPGTPETSSMRYFMELANGLNHREITRFWPEVAAHPFAARISEMRFLHNLVVLFRGDNTAPSNQGPMQGDPRLAEAIDTVRADTGLCPVLRAASLSALHTSPAEACAALPKDLAGRIAGAEAAELAPHAEVLARFGQMARQGGAQALARAAAARLHDLFPDNAEFTLHAMALAESAAAAAAVFDRFAGAALGSGHRALPLRDYHALAEQMEARPGRTARRAVLRICAEGLRHHPDNNALRVLSARAHLDLDAPDAALAALENNSGGKFGVAEVVALTRRAVEALRAPPPPAPARPRPDRPKAARATTGRRRR